jgi:hypothetical protein
MTDMFSGALPHPLLSVRVRGESNKKKRPPEWLYLGIRLFHYYFPFGIETPATV